MRDQSAGALVEAISKEISAPARIFGAAEVAALSAMRSRSALEDANLNPCEVLEPECIGGEHDPLGADRGSGDDEVVGAARATGSTDVGQQPAVGSSGRQRVVLDPERREHLVHERFTSRAMSSSCELDPYQELRHGHGRDSDVVVVGDRVLQTPLTPFGRDEDGRIQDQSFQSRSSVSSIDRMAASSRSHLVSGRLPSSRSLTARPDAATAGEMRATGRPFLVTTKVSFLCSTASRTSEKLRAASVAEMSLTGIRLSDREERG